MRNRTRLLTAALVGAFVLAFGVASANAARSFSATNNALLTYIMPIITFQGSAGRLVICQITLTASLHPAIFKTRGALLGFIDGGKTSNCMNDMGATEAAVTLLADHRRPWHITLQGFRGTLPRINELSTVVNQIGLLISVIEPIIRSRMGCLYLASQGMDTRGRTGREEYTIDSFIMQTGSYLLFEDRLNVSPFFECEPAFEFRGTFFPSLPPIIRLI